MSDLAEVRTTGWHRVRDLTKPIEASGNPEADAFEKAIMEQLATRPIRMLVRVPGNPPILESAKEYLLDVLCLFYRSAGESATHFVQHEGKALPICFRQKDIDAAKRIAWDWYDHVERHAEAVQRGGPVIPEIPNPYRFIHDEIAANLKIRF